MQPGSLVGGDVKAFTSRIVVTGVERAHSSWSVGRDLAGELPEQVAAVDGLKQATGTIVWAEGPDVTTRAVNPWNSGSGWLPKSGDSVVIYVSDGVTEWPQFTGVIDETSGEVGGSAQSTVVDDTDRLNTPFSIDALLRYMPPFTSGGTNRAIGLNYWHVTNAALRAAGFNATPPTDAEIAVLAPMQGSVWALGGTVKDAAQHSAPLTIPRFTAAPWGQAVSNGVVTYAPRVNYTPSTAVQLTLLVALDHAGVTTLDVTYSTDVIRLRVGADRSVQGYKIVSGASTLIFSFSAAAMAAATAVTIVHRAGAWKLINNAGGSLTASNTISDAAVMSLVTLTADDLSRVAGVQVSHPSVVSREFNPIGWKPNAVLVDGNLAPTMDASPAIVGSTVAAVLEQIGKATLTAGWFDEAGVYRMAPTDVLTGAASVQTVTTLDDITSLAWEASLLGVRNRVGCSWRRPEIEKRYYDTLTLYQGSGSTLEVGNTQVDLIDVPADEEWVMVDTSMSQDIYGSASDFNRARGSFTGGVIMDPEAVATSSDLTASFERISARTYKTTHTASSALPSDKSIILRTSETATSLWPMRRGMNLPLVRGRGKASWVDDYAESSTQGPITAPSLVHEVGPWGGAFVDGGSVALRIADYLAPKLATPQPIIRGLGVTYDPRRQLGDVITISSPDLMGVTLTALVVSVANSADGSYSQKLGVRIISATSEYTTYEQFNGAGVQITYDQWNLLEPLTLTHSQLNAQTPEVP